MRCPVRAYLLDSLIIADSLLFIDPPGRGWDARSNSQKASTD